MAYPDPYSTTAKRYLKQLVHPNPCYDSTKVLAELGQALIANKDNVLERLRKIKL